MAWRIRVLRTTVEEAWVELPTLTRAKAEMRAVIEAQKLPRDGWEFVDWEYDIDDSSSEHVPDEE